jgi:IS4 transposase
LFLISNILDLTAYEIAAMYKQRWDIEVFFKFLKQHLNLKHIVSRNENAIKVMVYMTLILAILIIVYKKTNDIKSFKIAKLKFEIELDNLIIKEIVKLCGGNPNKAKHLWNTG